MFNFKKHGMKKNYVTTAVALLLLAGCSNDIKETDIQFTGDTGDLQSQNISFLPDHRSIRCNE